MVKILRMNLDDGSWDPLNWEEFSKNSKQYLQQSRFEGDYYSHIQQLKAFGWSFFSPRRKNTDSPNVTFLMWDSEKINIINLRKSQMSSDRMAILDSYLRNNKIEDIVS